MMVNGFFRELCNEDISKASMRDVNRMRFMYALDILESFYCFKAIKVALSEINDDVVKRFYSDGGDVANESEC